MNTTDQRLQINLNTALFFALYGHLLSYAHSRHRVASPARAGFPDFLKCCNDPKEETRAGAAGINQLHIMSISLPSKVLDLSVEMIY